MRLVLPATLVLLLLQQSAAAPSSPRALLRDVLHAVESDSADAFQARWDAVLRRDQSNREALLASGSLARLTYRYDRADSLLGAVTGADQLALYARLELAHGLLIRGRFADAVTGYQRVLEGARTAGDSTLVAEALLGMAGPRSRMAPPAEVLASLAHAESLAAGNDTLVANARCQRAALMGRLGIPGAAELAQTGESLAERAGARRQQARCIQTRAQIVAAPGDQINAIPILERAAPLYRSARDHASLGSMLQWLGFLYNGLGRYGEALDVLTLALAEGERSQSQNVIGWSRINLGMIALGMGDRTGATQEFESAIAALERQGDQYGVITARSMLAGVARAAGDTAEARAGYAQVLDWARRSGDVRLQYNMHEALASISELEHDWPSARRQLDSAFSVQRRHRLNLSSTEAFRNGRLAMYQGDYRLAERELRRALADTDTTERPWRYATRALIAEAVMGRGDTAGAEAEMMAASEDLDRWRASLTDHELRVRAMQFEQGIDSDLGVATVIAGLTKAGRIPSAFALAERRRARELVDRLSRAGAARADSATIQRPRDVRAESTLAQLLDDSTALLEYVTGRGGEPTTLFVVTRRRMNAHRLLPIDSLERDISRFVTLLEADGDARELGIHLGNALIRPALGALGGIARLVIVPDDILARVPFDALVIGDGRYLLEQYAVGIAPSAAALTALRGRPAERRPVRILAMGDPRFDARDAGAAPATTVYRSAFDSVGGLPRLVASSAEARMAARHAPSSVVRLRGDASEAWLRAAPVDSFRVLHFATHALVDDQSPTRTALALAPGDGHDGFLGPADLAALRLDADLVVLSACRTARGELLRGEGLQGLTAPLLLAGTRSIVATSWRIEDRSAARIVGQFYEGLAEGMTVSEALRAAKLAALRSGARTSEWAAFVTLGDPSTRVPVVHAGGGFPGGWMALVLGLAAMALLAVRVYGMTRKRSGTASA